MREGWKHPDGHGGLLCLPPLGPVREHQPLQRRVFQGKQRRPDFEYKYIGLDMYLPHISIEARQGREG